MKLFTAKNELGAYISEIRNQGRSIGFVPTMGALHQGHVSLIKKARQENDIVVCSIFVNPLQFNNTEDLKKYPRTLTEDLTILEPAGCDAVFYPKVGEMYPDEVTEKYTFNHLDKVMEGKFRPGHFDGVAVVVNRLFNMVLPHRAYFGLKDYQQIAIVKSMMLQTGSTVELVPCPIIREVDGLAMSSRNVRLSPEARNLAPFIYQTLQWGKQQLGTASPAEVTKKVIDRFKLHPEFEPEYFEIVDSETLLPVETFDSSNPPMACIAVWLDQVRLIDNLVYEA
ncbi:MAG TPA: pantoate--beta-alanine ligase [Bacteroidales bacterium]|nr:MAG: pantoate--beta-alanine ligase [Bacteroidetes bacterium GWE2_42_24]OFY28706.1 MAG: pantoate--beta-alanine ligase [Bacteroidetes bacterium GWF2_43_11]HBZ66196.1 pantoate--beta-alanine ligase [Bacteroidales bacterium]